MHRRVHRAWLPVVVATLAVLVILPSLASEADAATYKWQAKCTANVRVSPSTTSKVLRIIARGAIVTAVGSVAGGRWSTSCDGGHAGNLWLKVVAINGRTTKSFFGRSVVYVARGLFKAVPLPPPPAPPPPPPPAPTPTPDTADLITNCSVRLRSAPSTDAATTTIIGDNIVVTAADSVSGGAWAADCATSVSGSSWYQIVEVGGQSVRSLYGVDQVYAATGLFRAAATSSYVEGIDVSKWQAVINWPMVAAAGKQFTIAKATEGVGYEDGRYDANKAGAMAAGLAFGAYHFARPDLNDDGAAEADWFVDTAGYQTGMIIPTLDLERTGGLTSTALTAWVKAWVTRVYARLGVRPMIYASPYFWRTYMANTHWFADNGYAMLWVAHWNTTSPSVPADNWSGKSWTFWQYTSEGIVPGISGAVDLDRYRFASFDAVRYVAP